MSSESRALFSLACIIIVLISTCSAVGISSQASFYIRSYNYKSSAGTPDVYPGSKGVELIVELEYRGSQRIEVSAGCLILPEGFSPSVGSQACSPPYTPNGSVYRTVAPGDIIIFKYRIDISEDVKPGLYELGIDISFRSGDAAEHYRIWGIYIEVKHYPEIILNVIDWSWSPYAYPGSEGVTLNIVLKNSGESAILRGTGIAYMPNVIEPSEIRFSLGSINKNETGTLTLRNLKIAPEAKSGELYTVRLRMNITASTDDNVVYESEVEVVLKINISSPPSIRLKVIDYGTTAPRFVDNIRYTRIYIILQNRDFVNIRAIAAVFEIASNATFINGSKRSITILSGNYRYGDYIEIESDPIILESLDELNNISVDVALFIFGDKEGAEFWNEVRYRLEIPIARPGVDVYVANVYWSQGEVFPGSNDVELDIVLENYDVVDLKDIIVTLRFPKGFYPSTLTLSGISIPRGSRTTLRFSGISIDPELQAGVHFVKLFLNGIAAHENEFYKFNSSFVVPVEVSSFKHKILEVIDYGWIEGPAYTTSKNLGIYVIFKVAKPYSVRNVIARICLAPRYVFRDSKLCKSIVVEGSYSYGNTIRVQIRGIDVVASKEGIYPIYVGIQAKASVRGASLWINETAMLMLKVVRPQLNISIIDSGWYNGFAYNESYGVVAYVTLQSTSIHRIENLILMLKPLGNDLRFENGKNYSIWTAERVLNYGEVITAVFRDIDVRTPKDRVYVEVNVKAILSNGESTYEAEKSFRVPLIITKDRSMILARVTTETNGVYTPLLPSAQNVEIVVDLINYKPYAIRSMKAVCMTSPGIEVKSISGSCLNGVAAGGRCSLRILVDVQEDVKPGNYLLYLNLLYLKDVGGSLLKSRESFIIPIHVYDINEFLPRIEILEWYWGIERPLTVFEHARSVPLSIIVMNYGRYRVEGVTLRLIPLNDSVSMITDSTLCSSSLPGGTSCRAVFYLDLANVTHGRLFFEVQLEYIFTMYGSHKIVKKTYSIDIEVDRFAGGKGLEIVDSDWLNNWPVYPRTENATLLLTIANKWPYSIRGIELKLYLPNGFTSNGNRVASTYIQGPVESLETFTAQFTISIGDVKPGTYDAKLVAKYVVETGGPRIQWVESFEIHLRVHDITDALQLISSTWYQSSPEPNTYGAILIATFRNNYIPQMKGIVLELFLPQGFVCALNNESHASIPLITKGTAISSRTSSIPPYMAKYIKMLSQIPTENVEVVTAGQVFSFYIPMHVLNVAPGRYVAKAYLNFIDQWNNVRRVRIELPINILGSSKFIEIETPHSIKIINGTALLSLDIINRGSAPIYNVYIYIVPQAPILIPKQMVKYVEVLPCNQRVRIDINMTYNPLAILNVAGGTMVRYNALPLTITIVYKDALGYQKVFNTSTSVLIEPFIDIGLGSDTKAEIRGNKLVVSGTIINYGLSTARSVEVELVIDNTRSKTFIGDIDPASQAAFRIETTVSKAIERVKLIVMFKDEYGKLDTREFSLSVHRVPVEITSTVTPHSTFGIQNYLAVVLIVAVFLAIVALIIYRYIKRHGRYIGGESGEI